MKKRNLELYLHIPFCVRKCNYCDFFSASGTEEEQAAYVSAMVQEIQSYQELSGEYEVQTIFLGGGTPSLLTPEQIEQIFNAIYHTFSISEDAEISIIAKKACSRASLHMDMENTPTLSQSVGQDNIGNIISALTDIYLLSTEEGYNGALLCIDEIEVSLHPDTQIRLLDLLDKISAELKIQVVVSTHSLTVLKECLKKEKKDSDRYKVIYLKNPSSPYVTEIKAYDLLKADLFGSLQYEKIKVRTYFEDCVGKELFNELIEAYRNIYTAVAKHPEEKILRNAEAVKNYQKINERILSLGAFGNICDELNQIVTHCGCDELLDISSADTFFNRVIIMLDGDARIAEKKSQPCVKDYLNTFFNPKEKGLSERKHSPNIIFAPGFFAPESFYYKIMALQG